MKICLVLACVCAVSALPGLRVALTEEGINKLLFSFYSDHISTSPVCLGDYASTLQWAGTTIDIQLHNVTLTSVSMDYSKSLVRFHSPNELTYTINDLSAEAKAECGVMFGLIQVSPGEATLGVRGAQMTIMAEIMTVRGKPHIDILDADFDIGSVYLQTQLPKEYNDIINKQLTAQFASWQKLLPYLAFKSGPDLNAYLKSLDFIFSCPIEDLAVDLGLVLGPDIEKDQYLVLGLNGTVIADGKAVEAGIPVETSEILSGKLISDFNGEISDFVGNSLLKSLWTRLNYTLSELPTEKHTPVTTSTFSMVIPQLKAKWGDAPMKLHFYARDSDLISYSSAEIIHADASVTVDFLVEKELEWVNALTLGLELTANASLSVENNIANVEIKQLKVLKVSQVASQSGDVPCAMLASMMSLAAMKAVETVNQALKDVKVLLPEELARIVQKDSVEVKHGFIAVGADF